MGSGGAGGGGERGRGSAAGSEPGGSEGRAPGRQRTLKGLKARQVYLTLNVAPPEAPSWMRPCPMSLTSCTSTT